MKWNRKLDIELAKYCTENGFEYYPMDDIAANIYDQHCNKIAEIRRNKGNVYKISWWLNYNPWNEKDKLELPHEQHFDYVEFTNNPTNYKVDNVSVFNLLRRSNKNFVDFGMTTQFLKEKIEEMKIDLLKLPKTVIEARYLDLKLQKRDKILNLKKKFQKK